MQGQAQCMDATASPYPSRVLGGANHTGKADQIHDDAVIAHQILVAMAGTDGADALALLWQYAASAAACCSE